MPFQILDLLDPPHVLPFYTMKSLDSQGIKSPFQPSQSHGMCVAFLECCRAEASALKPT